MSKCSQMKELQELDFTPTILVNNAGAAKDGLLLRMSEKDLSDSLNVNLVGSILLTKVSAPFLPPGCLSRSWVQNAVMVGTGSSERHGSVARRRYRQHRERMICPAPSRSRFREEMACALSMPWLFPTSRFAFRAGGWVTWQRGAMRIFRCEGWTSRLH